MTILKRCICYILLMLCVNAVLVIHGITHIGWAVAAGIFFGAFYIFFHIAALWSTAPSLRLRVLNGGYELTLSAILCFMLEILLYVYLILAKVPLPLHIMIINGVVAVVLLFLIVANGLIRIMICSKQVGLVPKVLLLFFWWVPIANIILLRKMLGISHREYHFTLDKQSRNDGRKQEKICQTKYPLLMVHGIFFRDWEVFNYWGRVPKDLTDNGAAIYYGNQQSSASVEQCAVELRQSIVDIVEKTGCEKVNIIAHSKGGLDCRYAISCLGMGKYVASLTTINTPHLGCKYVGKILDKVSDKAVAKIGETYESTFTKLGDSNPHFFSGLKNLTDQECERLNRLMPDDPRVLYQSTASRMRSASSAPFPLSVGHAMIKLFGGGDNDGLVSVESMAWGNFLGVLEPKGRQGISHGDMIDLTRKDIEGFDVCEFYVDIVSGLKRRGL